MSPPTKVEFKALRRDSKMWDDMADTMFKSADNAASIDFVFPEQAGSLREPYRDARDKVVRLLLQGRTAFGNISDSLSKVADVYEGTDDENAEKIKKEWQLHGN